MTRLACSRTSSPCLMTFFASGPRHGSVCRSLPAYHSKICTHLTQAADAEAAKLYEEFVDSFKGDSDEEDTQARGGRNEPKPFRHGGTVMPGSRPDGAFPLGILGRINRTALVAALSLPSFQFVLAASASSPNLLSSWSFCSEQLHKMVTSRRQTRNQRLT